MKKLLVALISSTVLLISTSRVASMATCNAPGFAAAESIRTSTHCCNDLPAIAVGDLNKDGRNDIVTGHGLSSSISVLLAGGQSYLPAINVPTGGRPFSVAIADLNNDTLPDVVAVNVFANNLSILLGDGAGGFTSTTQISAGSSPENVVTADFNADGNIDLAVTNSNSATVTVLFGNGAGGFPTSISSATGSVPVGLTSADFNLDGRPDLAVTNRNDQTVSVLLGLAAGGFQLASLPAVGATPQQIANGDFNGDGKPDLVVANLDSGNVSVLIGVGDGTFADAVNYAIGSQVTSVVVGDFNNDGHQDLAAASTFAGIVVKLGDGSGTFNGATKTTAAFGPNALAIDDFNRDGTADIVAAELETDTIVPLAGDGQGAFRQTPSQTTGTNAISVALADFNGDGKLDSVTANENTNTVSVRFGNNTNSFGNATNFAVGNRPFWVATGDFNGDNKPDIVTANFFFGGLSVLINDGSGSFGAATSVALPGNPLFVAVADVNNDNKQDLLAIRLNVFAVTVLLGNGSGGFSAPVDHATAPNPQTLAVGDFNGDNKVDLAVADGSFSILLGDGAGGFAAPLTTNFNTNTGPSEIVARDFNGDNKLDLALANQFTNDVSVMLGNGNATFAPRVNFNVGDHPVSLKAGDFNGDGLVDLVSGNNNSQNITLLTGNGAGSFSTVKNWAVPALPNSLAIGDVDNDGNPDLVAVGFNTLAVLLGQCGDGAVTPSALLSINDATVAEGNAGVANVALTVSLNAPAVQTVTAKFVTSSITAQRVADFQPATGTISFAPGETSKTVSVGVVGDTMDEFDEKIAVNLFEPTNALIADRQGTITIVDDDAPPTVSIGNASASENAATISLPVTLSQASGKLVTVDYATANGTALAGNDFVSKTGTLNIPAGTATTSIPISLVNDSNGEPDETFTVNLANPMNATINQAQGVATIIDDDGTTVQFSTNAFAATEGTELSIDVNRTGPTTGETFVSYATNDGTATDRRDYSAALGRLHFAAGETVKTIKVLITDDNYNDDGEAFSIALSNPVGANLGAPNSAAIAITDNDAADAISPVRDANFSADFFVRQHYADFLNRTPDADGLAFWVDQMSHCGSADLLVCHINVSAAFFLSIEFQETGYLVYRTHKAAFGNLAGAPVPVRQRPFLSDTRQIGDGVQVGMGDWQNQLEANKVAFFNEFVTRAQFTTLYGGLNNSQYVDALNANAGAVLTQSERDALVNALNGSTMTRAQVLRAVAENQTLKTNELNKAFVLLQYFGYLRRDPDAAPDNNFDGFNFWLNKLNTFNGNFIDAEMVKAFIQSIEYADRFGK